MQCSFNVKENVKMEIYREGKKIILTEQELFQAYEEQENIYDMEAVPMSFWRKSRL